MGSPIFDATFQTGRFEREKTGRFEREKTMTTIIVNKVAESIYEAMAEPIPGGISVAPWDTMSDVFKAGYVHAAKAAIATMGAAEPLESIAKELDYVPLGGAGNGA